MVKRIWGGSPHFQTVSGVLTTDSTANNRHLTAEGGATTGTGHIGNGIVLDGSNGSTRSDRI